MDGDLRREQLLHKIKESVTPISGETLSSLLGVSRQVIVQDIALLRACNHLILSTNRGYLMYPEKEKTLSRIYQVLHTTEEIKDELYTIVDCGGYIKNVMVNHEVYGMIQAELLIRSRLDVDFFIEKVNTSNAVPLKVLGGDMHFHTIEAESNAVLDEIEIQLKKKGYFVSLV